MSDNQILAISRYSVCKSMTVFLKTTCVFKLLCLLNCYLLKERRVLDVIYITSIFSWTSFDSYSVFWKADFTDNFFFYFNEQMLEVRLLYEINDIETPDGDQVPPVPTPGSNPQSIVPQSHPSTSSSSSDGLRDNVPCLR